jgi:hypothetical protein
MGRPEQLERIGLIRPDRLPREAAGWLTAAVDMPAERKLKLAKRLLRKYPDDEQVLEAARQIALAALEQHP